MTNDTLTLGTFTLSDAYLITLLLQHILVANQTLQFNGWPSVNIIVCVFNHYPTVARYKHDHALCTINVSTVPHTHEKIFQWEINRKVFVTTCKLD